MQFTTKQKYISIITLTLFIILIYSSINFNRINYLSDNIRSFFYNIYGEILTDTNGFKIIDFKKNKYIKPYKKLPSNMTHSGNFLFLKVKKGSKIIDAAKECILYTIFYKKFKLRDAIKEFNNIPNKTISKDMVLFIPYSIPPILSDIKNYTKPDIIYTRGLYFTGNSIGNKNVISKIAKFKKVGVNSIVFDVKDITGVVNYFSSVPKAQKLNTHKKRTIDNIDLLIRTLKKGGIYTIARIAVFQDHLLCKKNIDNAIKSKRTGRLWNAGSKEIWCDPTNKNVQDYNIQLAIELAEKGVDEIQFDYIRFPTVGNLSDAKYAYHYGKMSKEKSITHFLKRAYSEITKRNTLLSIDVFGVVAWGKAVDINKTGQRIESLSNFCDIISPMLYPSHFNDDFDGKSKPGDEPYHFIYEGCKKTNSLANGKVIRPWLQAFKWKVSSYDEDYILRQIIGSREGGAYGYLFWNSSSSYETVYKALYKLYIQKRGNPTANQNLLLKKIITSQ